MKQGVMIWGSIDLTWQLVVLVFININGLGSLAMSGVSSFTITNLTYCTIFWYTLMIIMDLLVIVGAVFDVRLHSC